MSYVKTVWKDRDVEKPRTYTAEENGDGSLTFTPAPGEVTEAGTPLSAVNLNHLENGIADATALLEGFAGESREQLADFEERITAIEANGTIPFVDGAEEVVMRVHTFTSRTEVSEFALVHGMTHTPNLMFVQRVRRNTVATHDVPGGFIRNIGDTNPSLATSIFHGSDYTTTRSLYFDFNVETITFDKTSGNYTCYWAAETYVFVLMYVPEVTA